MLAWDRFIRHSLTPLKPHEIKYIVFFVLTPFRKNYRARHVFTSDTFGAEYQSLSSIISTLEYHNGDSRYDLLLTEFFSDPSRSGQFYLDGDKYAGFAIVFMKYLITRCV